MIAAAILADPLHRPLPTYTADDAERALRADGIGCRRITLEDLGTLSAETYSALVMPYVDGPWSRTELDQLQRYHAAGGGLVFLGDTPHFGRSYPYRHSFAPQLRMTRCHDRLTLHGLTDTGQDLLGELPDLETLLGIDMPCVRTSAFPPDECIDLVSASGGFKALSPVVLIIRRDPGFLGARVAVAGFDGGEPRENILGVCDRPWRFDPGLLNRDWAGADILVARLVRAVQPTRIAAAIEGPPVSDAGCPVRVKLRVRNLTGERQRVRTCLNAPGPGTLLETDAIVEAGQHIVAGEAMVTCAPGPDRWYGSVSTSEGVTTDAVSRELFTGLPPPPQALGFSTYRAFGEAGVDDAFRTFMRETAVHGMQYVRMSLAWEDLEPEPGRYVWDVPDRLLELTDACGLAAMFWMFPTARGSGLSDAGIPAWTLREPAIDRDGRPGNFPCIWSPYYRERYFALLNELCQRYGRDDRLARFVFDFGNSDFAYTYHYYGDRRDLFDYSPHEQRAFASWLAGCNVPLDELERRWGRPFADYREVPVPYAEQTEAWLLYEEFRTWGVHQGIKEAAAVIASHCPDKAPPDFPGHGLGSIADLITYVYDATARHWNEIGERPEHLTELHNAGAEWGGEAWQVGAKYIDYDEALFQSVRLGAAYFTIPGPDLGIWGEDLGRTAMIRRTLAGSTRETPRIAILDHMAWNDWTSLAQVGSRLDQPVDLIGATCRYRYTGYDLLTLPAHDVAAHDGRRRSILPSDCSFYEELLDAVNRGLKVLVYPETGRGDPSNPFREVCGLTGVDYGPRTIRTISFPASWGGGLARGYARTVKASADDAAWLTDSNGEPVAVFCSHGQGGFLLVGHDQGRDSLDGDIRYDRDAGLAGHTLARLLCHLDIQPGRIRTGQACCWKEYIDSPAGPCVLLYSHRESESPLDLQIRSDGRSAHAWDLATGHRYALEPGEDPSHRILRLTLSPRRGYYLLLDPPDPAPHPNRTKKETCHA